ncbi:hypothetical protein H920_12098 [Fukomys damarensis]|uniref:Uncharacterized protein n=1 Tax=Fukomys damarensis TaxID=885580 RepID=A0A091D893_FUKDA|nr:hypothetical protein H920_12098 [Fukomys damarensis]
MAAAFIRGTLTFTVNITSWLHCGSLKTGGTNLSSHRHRFLTTGFWAFWVQILNKDNLGDIALGSRPLDGLQENIVLDSNPLAGLVWETAGI